jgi:hypothetical protein
MSESHPDHLPMIEAAAARAADAIPPAWPLASSVAVNPFLGQTNETLALAGARLGRVAGTAVTKSPLARSPTRTCWTPGPTPRRTGARPIWWR